MKRSERIKRIQREVDKASFYDDPSWRDLEFLLSEVKRYRGALEEVAGSDCYDEHPWTKGPCGVCLTCNARQALSDDEEEG